MNTDPFWINVENYLTAATRITGAAELIVTTNEMFKGWDASSAGEAFFPGSGGERQLCEALTEARWNVLYLEGDYFWAAKAPDGTCVLYIEGDLYQITSVRYAELEGN